MARDLKYGRVTVEFDSEERPLNGSDEPVFILRAQDLTALFAIASYETHQRIDANLATAEGAREAMAAFELFKREHPELMKKPSGRRWADGG